MTQEIQVIRPPKSYCLCWMQDCELFATIHINVPTRSVTKQELRLCEAHAIVLKERMRDRLERKVKR